LAAKSFSSTFHKFIFLIYFISKIWDVEVAELLQVENQEAAKVMGVAAPEVVIG
jgi:hypothetical protein